MFETWERNGRHLKPFPILSDDLMGIMTGVTEGTVKARGGGSRAYQRFQADKKKCGPLPHAMREFTDPLGTTYKFY